MRKIFVYIAVGLLRFINLFFKPFSLRDKVVIISRQSDKPTLDIQLLSDYLREIKIDTVVLTKTLQKSLGGVISYAGAMLVQMYHLATSRVVVLDGYCILVSVLPKRKGQQVVQMWHALGAIKKFGWQNADNPDGHGRDFSEIMKMHRNYDYILTPGSVTGKFFAEAFRASEDKLVYYGLPRIDFIRAEDEETKRSMFAAYPQLADKINVLYVPTFRKHAALELEKLVAGFDFARFNLIIKKHFLDKGDYSWAEKAGAIVDTEFSSMQWLRICPKVVTDYSAMAFEAAVLDRQLYIYQPDASEYAENVGLNVDLTQEAIGNYVCRTEAQLFEKLGEPYDTQAVELFRKRFLEIDLDNCTQRLGDFICSLLSSGGKKHSKRVLVLSRNYNNLLCMARSLAGGDYDIELVRLIQLNYKVMKLLARSYPERASRYVSAYHVCLTDWKAQKLVDFLMELYDPERETLLVSCDDLALPWMDESLDYLKKYYRLSDINGMQGQLAQMMNKQKQKQLVLNFGLPAANSHNITVRGGRYEIPDGISYPCFLKPAVLVMGSKDHLKKCDDAETLTRAVAALAAKFKDLDLLAEDFIDIKKEYAILGVSAGGRVLLPDGCLQFVQGGHGSRKGIMAVGEVASNPEILAFTEQLKAFVETLNYTGMFDVDALASDDGIFFCELNLRFGGSGYAITKAGVNLPRMYADFMLWGKPLPDSCKLDGIGKQFVSEKILLEDVTEKYIRREEAQRIIEAADIHFLADAADPEPYKKVERYFRFRAKVMMKLKELYKKVRH